MPKGVHTNHSRGASHPRWVGGLGHRLRDIPEYRSWSMMTNRCRNPKADDWVYYGGRGITICLRWYVFENFLEDMGKRPSPKHTLERKDGDKSYCKDNCIWATRQTQARNRAYVKLTLDKANEIRAAYKSGIVRQVDLAKQYGVCQRTISLIVRGEGWRAESGEKS